ncbi:hypothetical protein LTR17_006810 [Elasticomyces elasticus]|nr:hypothetical protein LTR17_006810 [Elasticomyces elasticus]
MPPAKARPAHEESRAEASTAKERQSAAATAKSRANGTTGNANGSSLKELALVSTESGNVVTPGQSTGVGKHMVTPASPDALTRHPLDGLEYGVDSHAQHIPCRPQPINTGRFHISLPPSTTKQPGYWSPVADNGQEEREAQGIERAAGVGGAEELQQRGGERDGCRGRAGVQSAASRQGIPNAITSCWDIEEAMKLNIGSRVTAIVRI